MRVIREPGEMRALAEDRRRDGRCIALVPTMGYLHEGHLSLLREGRARADISVLSIFVNPTQFAPGEDLESYPRDEAGDLEKARSCGVDVAFCPDAASMYGASHETVVSVPRLAAPLCGRSREGHFDGVATVVLKLLHICAPHVAVFGEKDFQQLAVIRRMVSDLSLGVEVVGMPIVREADGLAMSSRNRYLSAAERGRALALTTGLAAARALVSAGERDVEVIRNEGRRAIEQTIDRSKSDSIDYVELLDSETLTEIERLGREAILAVAVRIGRARLIDNTRLTP